MSLDEDRAAQRRLLEQIAMHVIDVPDLFSVLPVNRKRYDPRNIWSAPVKITLWCTAPGHEHPVADASYETSLPKDWFVQVLPHLRRMLRIVRLTPIARGVLGEYGAKEVASHLHVLEAVCKSIEDSLPEKDRPSVDRADAAVISRNGRVVSPSDRAMRRVLCDLGASDSFSPLSMMIASDGQAHWLCPDHLTQGANVTLGDAAGSAAVVGAIGDGDDAYARWQAAVYRQAESPAYFSKLLARAKDGDAEAELTLGHIHYRDGSLSEAERYLRRAARKGHRSAVGLFHRVVLELVDRGVADSVYEADMAALPRARSGELDAQLRIGAASWVGHHEPDAVIWFRKAAAQGSKLANGMLGLAYATGRGVEQDLDEAEGWLIKRAAGDSEATENIVFWFGEVRTARDSADRAFSIDMLNAELLEEIEEEVHALRGQESPELRRQPEPRSPASAEHDALLERARNGDVEAATKLASWKERPPGDLARLLEFARRGDAQAQAEVALAFLMENYEQLEKRLSRGVLGDPEVQARLGFSLWTTNFNKDAVEWFRKAAVQGHGIAQLMLGRAYMIGQGVQKDHRAASEWLGKAAKAGIPEAPIYQQALQAGKLWV